MKKIYDIHCHLFDLSHPNLIAFATHKDLIKARQIRLIAILGLIFMPLLVPLFIVTLAVSIFFTRTPVNVIRIVLSKTALKIQNLLSFMESAIEYSFLNLDYFLTQKTPVFNSFNTAAPSKVVLCPQVIDFGYKNLNNNNCFYNMPPSKPVVNQVNDLLNAIYFYFHYDITPHPTDERRLKIVPIENETLDQVKARKTFEIYPFLGINTKNYEYNDIVELFNKYFNGYEQDTPDERKEKMYHKMGAGYFSLEELITYKPGLNTDRYTYLFAGIKLYPPLGFDPWPVDPDELEKVKLLYRQCIAKRLPIIVHCSDGGFITDPDHETFTDPGNKWRMVLTHPDFKALKIDFAHMGDQGGYQTDWADTILQYTQTYPNVYTDCSFITPRVNDYKKRRRFLFEAGNRVLFGTDFSINLLTSKSYNDYIAAFVDTPWLSPRQKEEVSLINSERFLWG
jgi:hypothetical protein